MAPCFAIGHDWPMHVVAAPDKFRGTASARAVADAICRGATNEGFTCGGVPVADGGEGTLEVLGGGNRTTTVSGPLGDPVVARWRYAGGTAVIEMAQASGLALIGGAEGNDPVAATTYGTGELVAHALDMGAKRVLVGVGGSASTDGGLGALRALEPVSRLRGVQLLVACDVRTRFVDAARVFAPQKGATPAQVELLQRRLTRLVQVLDQTYGIDVSDLVGGGAGGGLGGGLAAVGGRPMSGFDVVADELSLHDRIEEADLVVTGEGFLDEQSFEGKVVGGVIQLARQTGIPVLVVVGEVLGALVVPAALSPESVTVVSLVERFGRERATTETLSCIESVVGDYLANHRPMGRG